MNHYTSPDFWHMFHDLPQEVQDLARANYELLKSNPHHPSLRFKKVGDYWSVRVGRGYRALATETDDGFLWAGLARTRNTIESFRSHRLLHNAAVATLSCVAREGGSRLIVGYVRPQRPERQPDHGVTGA